MLISRVANQSVCAVHWMEKFLRKAQRLPQHSLFGKIHASGCRQAILGSITYSRAREMFLTMATEARIISSPTQGRVEYGLHSSRAGGVLSALLNPGISVRLVQRHGGWRHLESMQGYQKGKMHSYRCQQVRSNASTIFSVATAMTQGFCIY